MNDDFKTYLQDFLKREPYKIDPKGIDFDCVTNFDTMWKQLQKYNINSSDIQRHLEVIFYLNERKIHLYNPNYKTTSQYSAVKDNWVRTNKDLHISMENYIEHFLLDKHQLLDVYENESIYAMGNPYELDDTECKLAKALITKLSLNSQDHDAEDDTINDTPDKITGAIMAADTHLIEKLCRPLTQNYKKSIPTYAGGGLISGLKRYLDFDITQFTEKEHRAEICKIIYFFDQLQHKHIPELQNKGTNKKTKEFHVVDFFSKPSLENVDYSLSKRKTYNGKIIQFIKNMLEKEMSVKVICDIRSALDQVATPWNNLLDDAHKAISTGKDFNFNERFRAFESILSRPHKWVSTYSELHKYASNFTFLRRDLDAEEESSMLKSIRYEAEETTEDTRCYIFKKREKDQELNFNQGLCTLESICNGPHKAMVATWDDTRCYTFKSIREGKVQEIHVWESLVDESHMEASPIETLYLKISQFERLGETKDMTWVNGIETEGNYNVTQKFIDKMKPLTEETIDIDGVNEYIDKNIFEIAGLVYLKLNPTVTQQQKILGCQLEIMTVLKYCTHARPFINMGEKIPKLLVISCLQAILIDKKCKETYDPFYNYQTHLETKHDLKIRLVKGKPMPEAIKLCWARKTVEHWYANLGKYKRRRQLREFESKCYDVLTELYSCSNISELLSKNQDYYDKLTQFSVTAGADNLL